MNKPDSISNLHLYGAAFTTVPVAVASSAEVFWFFYKSENRFDRLPYSQDGDHWGREVSSVSHSSFYPLWVYVFIVHCMLRYCVHKCTTATVSVNECELRHRLSFPCGLYLTLVWTDHAPKLTGIHEGAKWCVSQKNPPSLSSPTFPSQQCEGMMNVLLDWSRSRMNSNLPVQTEVALPRVGYVSDFSTTCITRKRLDLGHFCLLCESIDRLIYLSWSDRLSFKLVFA